MNAGRKSPARAPSRAGKPGSVRIIGGRWRGTRLPVPDRPGLRPTSDRVRETLFNWLQPVLPGARVLDLFAGSGALGLEALSRGAASAQLVEADAGLAMGLKAAGWPPGCRWAGSTCMPAMPWRGCAAAPAAAFDIAFVDPPFDAGLWDAVLALLPARMARAGVDLPRIPGGAGAGFARRMVACIGKAIPGMCAMPCIGAGDAVHLTSGE